MKKLKLSFSQFSDPNFGNISEAIVTAMTDNTYYTTPVPALSVVADAIGVYLSSLIAAKTRDKTAVATKNQHRQELTLVLVQLGTYVMLTANGDVTALTSSGFELAKTPAPTPPLEAPVGFVVSIGINPGELLMKVKPQASAKGYQFQVSTTDPTASEAAVWISLVNSSSKVTFSGLDTGKRYWCRVGITGPFNQLVYSEVVTKIPQ